MSIIQNAQGFTPVAKVGRKPAGLLAYLIAARDARRSRTALAGLDDRALADIGLTREQARREAARPLWDLPAHLAR